MSVDTDKLRRYAVRLSTSSHRGEAWTVTDAAAELERWKARAEFLACAHAGGPGDYITLEVDQADGWCGIIVERPDGEGRIDYESEADPDRDSSPFWHCVDQAAGLEDSE